MSFWVNVAMTYLRSVLCGEFNFSQIAIWENYLSWESFTHHYPRWDSQTHQLWLAWLPAGLGQQTGPEVVWVGWLYLEQRAVLCELCTTKYRMKPRSSSGDVCQIKIKALQSSFGSHRVKPAWCLSQVQKHSLWSYLGSRVCSGIWSLEFLSKNCMVFLAWDWSANPYGNISTSLNGCQVLVHLKIMTKPGQFLRGTEWIKYPRAKTGANWYRYVEGLTENMK